MPARVEALAALGGLSREALHSQLAAAVQVVLQVHRRRLVGIGVLRREGDQVTVRPAWERDTGWEIGCDDLASLLESRGGALPC